MYNITCMVNDLKQKEHFNEDNNQKSENQFKNFRKLLVKLVVLQVKCFNEVQAQSLRRQNLKTDV